MPRTCKSCGPKRAEIDRDLVTGEALRTIGDRHGVSHQALIRHRDRHLSTAVQVSAEGTVLEQASALWEDAQALKEAAKEKGDLNLALKAVDRLTKLVELRGKATGELGTNIHLHAHRHERHDAETDEPEELAGAFLALLQAEPDALSERMRRALVVELLDGVPIDTIGEDATRNAASENAEPSTENVASVEAAQ